MSAGHRSWVSGHRPAERTLLGSRGALPLTPLVLGRTASSGLFPQPQAGAEGEHRGADMEIGEEGHRVGGRAAATDPGHLQQVGGRRWAPALSAEKSPRRTVPDHSGSSPRSGTRLRQRSHLTDADRDWPGLSVDPAEKSLSRRQLGWSEEHLLAE